jgi:hypothetical protein
MGRFRRYSRGDPAAPPSGLLYGHHEAELLALPLDQSRADSPARLLQQAGYLHVAQLRVHQTHAAQRGFQLGHPSIGLLRRVAKRAAMQPKVPTGLSGRATAPVHHSHDNLTFVTGAHSFLSSASFSSSLPSISSASMRFNRAFSFCSSLSCLAWSSYIMPNLRFQRWKVCSLMPCSWHTLTIVRPTCSASRNMRIFCSLVYLWPFIVWVLSDVPD